MRFLVDAQLPPALAKHLSALGHEAEHVNDVGLVAVPDVAVWAYAISTAAVLVSKDQDFARLAGLKQDGAPVVWIRLGNTTNDALWRAVSPILPEIIDAIASGEKLVEIT